MRTFTLIPVLLLVSSATQSSVTTTLPFVSNSPTTDGGGLNTNVSLLAKAYNESTVNPTTAYNESTVNPTTAYNESTVNPTTAYNESTVIPTTAYNESTVNPTTAYTESTVIPTDDYNESEVIVTEAYNKSDAMNPDEEMVNSTSVEPRVDYLGYVVVPLFFVVGLCGNGMTIAVMFSRKFRNLTTSIILVALAASDGIFTCISPFNRKFIRIMIGYDIRAVSRIGCSVFFIIFKSSKMASSWFIVFVCFERFVAVWFPLKIKIICTRRITYIAVAVVFIGLIVYNIAWDFATQIVDGNCVPNYATPETADMARAFLIVGTFFYSLIPVVILLVLTPAICIQLRRHTVLRRQLSGKSDSRGDETAKTTTMLLGVTFAFIILVTPVSIAHNVTFALGENFFESTKFGMVVVRDILQVMEQLNYSINFFMYVLCSRAFRMRVAEILGCKRATEPRSPATMMYSISTVS